MSPLIPCLTSLPPFATSSVVMFTTLVVALPVAFVVLPVVFVVLPVVEPVVVVEPPPQYIEVFKISQANVPKKSSLDVGSKNAFKALFHIEITELSSLKLVRSQVEKSGYIPSKALSKLFSVATFLNTLYNFILFISKLILKIFYSHLSCFRFRLLLLLLC